MKKQTEEKIDALYARLSQEDEKDGVSGSIENQRIILERYAKDNGFDNPKFFFDDGWSGTNFARPAFVEIMKLAEEGKVRTLIVKDHSRLGRNRLVVGQLLEEGFEELGVRYIAIMDNIDTAKGLDDTVAFKDLFNEWHAKNTSEKVRNVARSKGLSGKPLSTTPPYGYIEDENDKNKWNIDEPAAETVRRIYKLCIDGYGTSQIANMLRDEKVLTPTNYKKALKGITDYSDNPYNWCSHTVSDILARPEYIGSTVNFRTKVKSFKNKKIIRRPQEEWVIFENTHPAIIDEDTFNTVQNIREKRRRPTKSGVTSMFSSLVICGDCGHYLTFNAAAKYPHFLCSNYRKDTHNCSSHYIRDEILYELVLESMRRVLFFAKYSEQDFINQQMEKNGLEQKKEIAKRQKELDKATIRIKEIDTLIQKLYEDFALGRMDEDRYATMSMSLETEQKNLKEQLPTMEAELNKTIDKSKDIERFVNNAKRLTDLTELTPDILNEFVAQIFVSSKENEQGKKQMYIDIYYKGVGFYDEPNEFQMELNYRKVLAKKQNKKTA